MKNVIKFEKFHLKGVVVVMKKRMAIIILLLAVLSSVIFVATNSYKSTRNSILETIEKETDELRSNFANETKRFSNARITELQLIAAYLAIIDEQDKSMLPFLHKQNDKMPLFAGLGFISPEGQIFTADGEQFPVQQKESFEKALAGEVVFSDVFPLHQDPTQKVTAISVPVIKADEVIGVVSGVVNMANVISELIEESDLPGTLFLFKGKDLVFSSIEGNEKSKVLKNLEQISEHVNEGVSGSILIDEKKAHFLKYERTFDDWLVVVDSSTNPKSERLEEAFWDSALLIIMIVIVILAIYIYIRYEDKQEAVRTKRDLLTGLDNRTQLEEDLLMRLQKSPEKKFLLLLIDLDRFKEINERIGYQIGDRILFELSKRFRVFPNKVNLYRVDGDEFVLILNEETEEELKHTASSLLKRIELPIDLGAGSSIWLTASIGARTSKIEDNGDLIMQDATFATQEAKRRGGNRYVYFSKQLEEVSSHSRLVTKNLDTALENNELYLLYQPIYGIDAESIVSYETLMRWKNQELGEVSPADFIPFLEDSDLIIPVGRWLIKEVASQVLRWEKEGYTGFTVTLNVSVKQLIHPDFLTEVRKVLKETGVSPERIVFELTESVVVQHIEYAYEVLSTLNSIGIQTALDDFGTGYSSLSILKVLPFQYVKVDQAFVKEVELDGGVSKAILKGIIDIVISLELTTIMEGVETVQQFTLLKDMGAHRIQGYLISKPVLPHEAIKLLEVSVNSLKDKEF